MRYVNPHMQHPQQGHMQQPMMQQPMMNPQMMQPMQQPMMPMGQYPQQQFMPQQYPQQFPQQYPQQGMMPQQQYPQQFPQQYPQQGMMPQQTNQPTVNTSRFTGQQPQSQQFNTGPVESSRYQTTQQPQVFEEQETKVVPFTIKPTIHTFPNNEKIKLNTITTEVKSTSVRIIEGSLASDCLQEDIESLIESAYESEDGKAITARNFIISHNFYRTNNNDTIKELLSNDVKYLYKAIKTVYKETSDKYSICVYDKLDDLITERINDFIAIHASESISIDSFFTDFNDLLKIIRNTEEDLEDNLLEYLDNFIIDLRNNLNSIDKPEDYTILTEPISMVYLDKHVLETGLEVIDGNFITLEKTPPNVFLHSLVNVVSTMMKKRELLLVTLDRSVFKCYMDEDYNVYIRLYQS